MNVVSVLTPTYNRKELLLVLYKSLCLQNDLSFDWIVIDDGSTDGTEGLMHEIQVKAPFSIIYKKKPNGGKHTALNYAYPYIDSILTIIVDSDDTLTPDAISTIKEVYEKYKKEEDLCGFSFLRSKPNGEYLSTSGVPSDAMKESFVDCRINRHIGGDMAEVWYTDCLREYPFPEFPGEKFLGEDLVWIRMSEKYKMRFFNRAIYISDYLEDGLTHNRRKHNIASPKGCVARAEAFLDSKANFKVKVKAGLQYYIYGRFAQMSFKELYVRSGNKFMYVALIIPAQLIYLNWKLSVKR